MEVHICPVRELYRRIAAGEIDTHRAAALLSSSYPIETERLGAMPFVFCEYDDLDREVPGRSFPLDGGATAFAAFLKELDSRTADLYCCCDGGCRRSAAVACSAMRYLGQDEFTVWENPAYEPNPLVYTMLCEALGIPVTDEALDLRIETSRQAFRRAIRK